MYQLLPFQSEDVEWLGRVGNALLANACGTGKTLTAVEAAKRYARGPVLVICPRMVKLWWRDVIKAQGAGYVGVCGRAGRGIPWHKLANWGNKKPLIWVVIHHDVTRMAVSQLRRVKWDVIIADEAHAYKNRKAQRTKALWKIPSRWRMALTATPYGNNPADMWALLHWLFPRKYTSYWRFRNHYVQEYQPYGQRFKIFQGTKNLKQLAKEISPFYRKRRKEDVLDLPSLTVADVPVVINGWQENLYTQLLRDSYIELGQHEVILENALVKMLRLQQCALDPALVLPTVATVTKQRVPAKIEWLREWLEDHPEEPVVIVSRYRKFVERWLRELSLGAVIVGGMSQNRVQAALKKFEQTGRLVGSLDAVKEGLNLQRASTMIVMDGTYSVTAAYQLSQRIHRVGQTRKCQVIYLIGELSSGKRRSTVDALIRKAVTRKMSEQQLVDSFVREIQNGHTASSISGRSVSSNPGRVPTRSTEEET